MQAPIKFIRAAAMAIALSAALSACQPKTEKPLDKMTQTPENLEAYWAQYPYHEQSEAEQAKSLQVFVEVLNTQFPDIRSEAEKMNVSAHYEADPSRDMVVLYGVYEKPITQQQLEVAKSSIAKAKEVKNLCITPDAELVFRSGIGLETIVHTKAGELLYKLTCPGTSAEMYALRKNLLKRRYETRTKAEKAQALQAYVGELQQHDFAANISHKIKWDADPSRDLIIGYAADTKSISPKELVAFEKQVLDEKPFKDLCKTNGVLEHTAYGFGFQFMYEDASGKVLYESPICRSPSAIPKLRGSKA